MKQRWIGSVGPPPLAREELEPIVAAVLPGLRVEDLRALSGGFRNHNFALKSALGRPIAGVPDGAYLLRIYAPADRSAFKEQRVAQLVRGVLRTPQYLRVEQVGDRLVALRAFEVGRPLHELLLDPLQLTFGLGVQLGDTLARLHAFQFERHGELGEQLQIVNAYDLSAAGLLGYVRGLVAGVSGERLGEELSRGVLELWRAQGHALEAWTAQPRLIHADFGPTNLIACEDGALSVIDWEFACSNHPGFDFGNLLRPPLESAADLQRGLAAGYQRAGGRLPEGWQMLARFADTLAWLQLLSRPDCHQLVAADARERIGSAIGAFRDALGA
jgi:aminoglycoside phosphotransferase (APT) family kinase protein